MPEKRVLGLQRLAGVIREVFYVIDPSVNDFEEFALPADSAAFHYPFLEGLLHVEPVQVAIQAGRMSPE